MTALPTSLYFSIGSLIVTLIISLLSATPPFYIPENKGLKKLTKKAYALMFAPFLMTFNILTIVATFKEKKDASDKSDRKEIAANQKVDSVIKIGTKHTGQLDNIDEILHKQYNLALKRDSAGNITVVKYITTQSLITCPIHVVIAEKPDNILQHLCNGDKIPSQYRVNPNGTLTIPYMKGKSFAGNLVMDGYSCTEVGYDKNTGTFDVSRYGGFGVGNVIQLTANMPNIER